MRRTDTDDDQNEDGKEEQKQQQHQQLHHNFVFTMPLKPETNFWRDCCLIVTNKNKTKRPKSSLAIMWASIILRNWKERKKIKMNIAESETCNME